MATRRESVRLELVDAGFTTGMAKAAAMTALLNRELRGLDGLNVQLDRSSQMFVRDIRRMGSESRGAAKEIDSLSGRVSILGDLLLTLGPAAVPVGAVAAPAVAALASSLGFAVVAAGSAAVAFGGVGDALEKMNKAHLDPTKENLAEAEKAMKRLAPAARDFVRQIDSMRGLGASLRDAGAQSLFPGLTEALETLESRGPDAERVLRAINDTVGEIAAEGAASLASERWDDFFTMLVTEGPPTLDKTADALGNVVHGLSEVFEAMAPLNQDGLDWLVDLTEGFDEWSQGLKNSTGFAEFTSYVRETGPEVVETVAAVSEALLDIAEAAAPLGGPALNAIEGVARAVSAIASSDFATPLLAAIAAMRTINRLSPVTSGALAMLSRTPNDGPNAAAAGAGKRGGRLAGAASGIVGGPWGLALTGSVAVLAAFADAQAEAEAQVDGLRDSLNEQTGAITGNTKAFMARTLEDEGVLSDARDLGLNLELVTKAALGNKKAVADLNGQLEAIAEADTRWSKGMHGETVPILGEQARAAVKVADAVGTGNKAIREARDEFGRLAEASGNATGKVDGLDGVLRDLPPRVQTRVELAAEQAMSNARAIKAELASIDRRIDVYVNVRRPNAGGLGPQITPADGITVPGPRYPYGDKIHAFLAPGEEVISNRYGQADRHRALLKRINANALADGGTAGRREAQAGRFAFDNTDSLQAAIDRLTTVAQDQTRAVEDSTRRTDEWAQKMSEVAQATISGFDTGLFEKDSNPWAAGAGGGPLANLMRDIAGLNERSGLQSQLAGMGLSGDALGALLGQGSNSDIAGLIASGQVGQYADLYNQRAALQGSVSQQGAQAAFGAQYAESLKVQQALAASARTTELEIVRLNSKVEALTAALAYVPDQIGEGMGRVVNGAASKGHRDRRNGGGPV